MSDVPNAYMRLRKDKIARNEAKLKELGLFGNDVSHGQGRRVSKSRKRSRDVVEGPKLLNETVASRRSGRLRGQKADESLALPSDDDNKRDGASGKLALRATRKRQRRSPSKNRSAGATAAVSDGTRSALPNAGRKPRLPSRPAGSSSLSVRDVQLDIRKLMFGKTNGHDGSLRQYADGVVGKHMRHYTKDVVVNDCFQLAADDIVTQDDPQQQGDGGLQSQHLSFNKYCGVQPWASDAYFLWINLNAPKADVTNEFRNGGRQVTWFGGSRMHDATPVIQDLIRAGRNQAKIHGLAFDHEDEDGTNDHDEQTDGSSRKSIESSGIVLFCRRYDSIHKKYTPYVCLGRLAYSSHKVGSSPVSFVWTLIDRDRLSLHCRARIDILSDDGEPSILDG